MGEPNSTILVANISSAVSDLIKLIWPSSYPIAQNYPFSEISKLVGDTESYLEKIF